jgi:hypothetical protein
MDLKLEREEKETLFMFMNAILPHFGSRLMLEVAISTSVPFLFRDEPKFLKSPGVKM